MDISRLCTDPALLSEERALVEDFVNATNAADLAALTGLFAADAHVNDQLRNFWGLVDIRHWLEREIVGARIQLNVLRIRKHYDSVIGVAEISGAFEAPRTGVPMVIDLIFTVRAQRIVRLLILLARDDEPDQEIRPVAR